MSLKADTFQSGITQKAITLAAVPMIVAGLLVYQGARYFNLFNDQVHGSLRLVMGVLPMLFGLAIIGVAVATLLKNLGKKVVVSKDGISYEHGAEKFSVRWEMLAFSAPPPGKKMLRALSISDGNNFARIEELFFPRFDNLLQIVSSAKQRKMSSIEL